MKLWWHRSGKIIAALVVIFAGGYGVGWALGHRPAEPVRFSATPLGPSYSQETLDRLTSALKLTPAQREQLGPTLAALEIDLAHEKENALFRSGVRLFSLHDEIEPFLTPEQKLELARSRTDMDAFLRSRFEQYFKKASTP
jgi:hypothetical protein